MAEQDLQTYLRNEGLIIPPRHPKIEKELKRSLGSDAYDDYCATAEGVVRGRYPISTLYDCVTTVEQAHLLFSHQSHVALCAYGWLSARVRQMGNKVKTLADMGCATGLLANFVAEGSPDVQVTGYDRNERFIGWAQARYKRANLRFEVWDYAAADKSDPKFDMMISAMGIDWPSCHLVIGPGLEDIRKREYYEFLLAAARGIFLAWSGIAKPSATLAAVLRIPDVAAFIAVADAAAEAGWRVRLNDCRALNVKDETFSGLVFTRGEPGLMDETDLVSYWITRDLTESPLSDAAAFAVFNQLKNPEVIAHEKHEFPDGNVLQSSVCVSGPFLIRFSEATTGFARLEVFPVHKRGEVKPELFGNL